MQALGIDPKLILAQIVNFLVLFIVLKKFLYKPLLKFFETRKIRIEEGLANAEKIKKELAEIDGKKAEIFKKAREEAAKVTGEEMKAVEVQKEALLEEAKRQAEAEAKKGGEIIRLETEKARESLRKEAVEIALNMTKKMMGELSEEDKHKLIGRSLE